MKNSTIALIAVGIVIIILGGFFVFSKENKPEVAESPKQINEITPTIEIAPTSKPQVTVPVSIKPTQKETNVPKQYSAYPSMVIDSSKSYTATMETSKGVITLELYAKDTPKTVNNFVFLARDGFYDGVIFHRIIKGFMIQGGDPEGTGRGGPGYLFADEPVTKDYLRGTLAMANAGPNTNGSQFFIMHQDGLTLPKSYTIFGKVIKGIEVVDAIASVPTTGPEGSTPTEKVTITKVTIEEK